MSAPLWEYIPALSSTGGDAYVRRIDNHYHLELAARSSQELLACNQRMVQLEGRVAAAHMSQLSALVAAQEGTNELLANLGEDLAEIRLCLGDIENALEVQTRVIGEGLSRLAELMLDQNRALREIADTLRRPYETQTRELLGSAEAALRSGMRSGGRDRDEHYREALQNLGEVLENPIGRRNYIAWFQLGWLRWKHLEDLEQAEEAFYHGARLSADRGYLYHVRSLRHLAYMKYKRGRHAEAYEVMQKARAVAADDYDVLYDAARYAARTGRADEALRLLSQCIDLQPETIVTMFSEQDFVEQ